MILRFFDAFYFSRWMRRPKRRALSAWMWWAPRRSCYFRQWMPVLFSCDVHPRSPTQYMRENLLRAHYTLNTCIYIAHSVRVLATYASSRCPVWWTTRHFFVFSARAPQTPCCTHAKSEERLLLVFARVNLKWSVSVTHFAPELVMCTSAQSFFEQY
jgi:hypothetical protein